MARVPLDRSAAPALGPVPAFTFPGIERHVLPNGLKVRTVEHTSAPVLTLAVQVEGGSGADPAAQEGLASLVADMVDEGTGSLSAIDVSDALSRIGGDYDVDTGPDAIGFSLTTLARFADRGADLLAGLLTRPSLRESDFARIRQLRIDRLRQIKDVASAVAERAFLRLLYGRHPYGHAPLGNEESLRVLSLDDVAGFHTLMFRPSQSTLVLVGGMRHAELLGVAERAFGGWAEPSGQAPVRTPASTIPPELTMRRIALVHREAAAQSELRIGHLAASRRTPDYAPLLVMNAILGGQFTSRVNMKLREEKAYTYGARTSFDWKRGLAPFALSTSVHTASTAAAIADASAEIEGIRGSRPVTEHELAHAKAALTRGYPAGFETAAQVARAVSQLALYDLPDTYFSDFVPTVGAVTAAEVTRVAAQYLDPARLTALVVGDAQVVADSLHTLSFGEPLQLPVQM
ncbi:MAG TPA: pitrilysin family protein [Vicinamibacterales bacterium]|nr:pitrilysin family protein [Vicinamibacterales bacterium]